MPDAQVSFAHYYHQRTKYDPETIASKSRRLDFSQQPVPYKTYQVGNEIDLKPYLEEGAPKGTWGRLSRLLLNSYGLTAKLVSAMGEAFYLRAAPSAGGLYPAEIYLISRGAAQLAAGLYNYQVRTHSLWRYWEDHLWQELQAACFWHPALEATHLALVVTGVFYRSVWRYQDRAYRRIFLDSGHLLGNLALAGTLADYRPHLITGFADRAITDLLYLDPDQEGAIAVLPLADLLEVSQNLPHTAAALAAPIRKSNAHVPDGELFYQFHRATEISSEQDVQWQSRFPENSLLLEDKYNFPFCLKVSTGTEPIDWGNTLVQLEETLLKRRSTRRYSGDDMTLSDLSALLDFAYQPRHYQDQGFDADPDYCDLSLLQTFVVVSGVKGLEVGCYYYAPARQELRQVRFKNFRQELHYLCLGQDLGRDAAAVVIHTADLKAGVEKYGDRVYRYLHLDAGHMGQRLNLAATRLGIGVSGIAGFFDDQVNEMLGIPTDEAVIYITTLGQPAKAPS